MQNGTVQQPSLDMCTIQQTKPKVEHWADFFLYENKHKKQPGAWVRVGVCGRSVGKNEGVLDS